MAASGSEIRLVLNEKNPRYHETGREVELWREFITSSVHKTGSISWTRVSIALPHNISHDFELEFSASIGFRGMGTGSRNRQIIALDSISLSKECFGIGIFFTLIKSCLMSIFFLFDWQVFPKVKFVFLLQLSFLNPVYRLLFPQIIRLKVRNYSSFS